MQPPPRTALKNLHTLCNLVLVGRPDSITQSIWCRIRTSCCPCTSRHKDKYLHSKSISPSRPRARSTVASGVFKLQCKDDEDSEKKRKFPITVAFVGSEREKEAAITITWRTEGTGTGRRFRDRYSSLCCDLLQVCSAQKRCV